MQHSATLRCSLKRGWAGAPLIAVFDEWEYSKVGWVAHPFPFRLQGAAFGKAKAKPKHKILRLRSPALEKTRGNPPALRMTICPSCAPGRQSALLDPEVTDGTFSRNMGDRNMGDRREIWGTDGTLSSRCKICPRMGNVPSVPWFSVPWSSRLDDLYQATPGASDRIFFFRIGRYTQTLL